MAAGRLAILLSLLLTLPVSAANAAQSQVDLQVPESPTIPPGQTRNLTVKIVYTYSGEGTTTGEVTVDLTTSGEAPASASVRPNPKTIQVNDQKKRGTGTVTWTIDMAESAEAFTRPRIEITAKARSSGTVEASERTRAFLSPKVPFVPGFRSEPTSESVGVSDTGLHPVEIQVTNQANGPVLYRIETVSSPPGLGVSPEPASRLPYRDGHDTETSVVQLFRGAEGSVEGEVVLRTLYGPATTSTLQYGTDTFTIDVHRVTGPGPLLVGASLGIAVIAAGAAVWWFKLR